ncbi:MAG: hypothetical protein LC798_16850 [Chloroflexi bacterium]|nr:hypothetical protein [Chloroflexota bacterium]
MFDRQRLADIIRTHESGDLRELADEVVRLMGQRVEAERACRAAETERDLWKGAAGEAHSERERAVGLLVDVFDAVPKTRRKNFPEVEQVVSERVKT